MKIRKVFGTVCAAALAFCAIGINSQPVQAATVKTINVTSYGANGSDSADDTDAFQKALDTAKNSSVPVKIVVPSGRYYLGLPPGKTARSLKIYSNTTLQLESGAILMRQKNAPDVYIMETDDQKILPSAEEPSMATPRLPRRQRGLFLSDQRITLTFRASRSGTTAVLTA